MIYLNPSYPSCIYTKIQFVSYQAKQYDATAILTFDQPLYWKALTCIQSQTVGHKAERMGNCEQHIQTVHDMLPYLPHLVTHDMQRLHTDMLKLFFVFQKLIQMPIINSWKDTMC